MQGEEIEYITMGQESFQGPNLFWAFRMLGLIIHQGYWKYISKLPTTTESEKDIYRMGKGWSGGFSVVMLSLHLCEKVDIYGFSGGDVTKSQKGHYYSRPNVRVKQGMRHNYGAELHCLQQIHAAKIERIRVFF
mmetsp:Transcript_17253/g.55299  ORF Transcript_17253/g.55299 Transcript_17253/m.55299 type:complete len:134 (+) Transcript_17253:773-1174(+)